MVTLDDTAHTLLNNASGKGDKVICHCNDKENLSSESTTCSCSVRLQHAIVGLFFGFVLYMYRVNMSIALPFMVFTANQPSNDTSAFNLTLNLTQPQGDSCGVYISKMERDSKGAEFSWDKTTQSFVLSGYYYGYIVAQIPLTWVTRRFGGKNVVTTCMIISAGLNLLVPVLARASVYAVIVSRILLGVASGATIPAWYAILGAWALPHERSRFNACHCFGKCAGTVFGYFTAGVLCAHGFDNGWGSVFYVHGSLGALFVVLWVLVMADSPDKHPRMAKEEQALFEQFQISRKQDAAKVERVPWLAILTSVPVWTIFITHAFDNFTLYLILISLPQFLKDVMKYDIQSNGVFSSLPSITNALSLVVAGFVADAIIKRRWFSTTVTRKAFQITGLLGAAAFIVIPGYMNCHQRAVAIVCLCGCMLFNALGQSVGYPCSAVDIAPRYASVIYSISNTVASIPGMLVPLAVAELTPNGAAEEWRVVFYIAAGLCVFAAVLYGGFSSSELAPWANGPHQEVTVHVDADSPVAEKSALTLENPETNIPFINHETNTVRK